MVVVIANVTGLFSIEVILLVFICTFSDSVLRRVVPLFRSNVDDS